MRRKKGQRERALSSREPWHITQKDVRHSQGQHYLHYEMSGIKYFSLPLTWILADILSVSLRRSFLLLQTCSNLPWKASNKSNQKQRNQKLKLSGSSVVSGFFMHKQTLNIKRACDRLIRCRSHDGLQRGAKNSLAYAASVPVSHISLLLRGSIFASLQPWQRPISL